MNKDKVLNQEMESAKLDGHHFLKLLSNQKSRILKLANDAEKELEKIPADETDSSSDDTSGLIRSVIGKARLLANDKFKQFQGLCEENIKVDCEGPNKIHADDLQGFWDMMMLQVESVDAAFKELEEYRQNGWKKPVKNHEEVRKAKRPLSNKSKSALNIPSKKPIVEVNPAAAKKREEQRKKLLEMKRKFKSAAENDPEVDENLILN